MRITYIILIYSNYNFYFINFLNFPNLINLKKYFKNKNPLIINKNVSSFSYPLTYHVVSSWILPNI